MSRTPATLRSFVALRSLATPRTLAAAACGAIWGLFAAAVAAEDLPPSPAPQPQIEKRIDIEWSIGPDLPQGFQDSNGGFIGSELITACGFCSGGLPEDNRRKPGRSPRGFLQKTWALNIADPKAQWKALPDFPGAARQGIASAVLDEALFIWGGFSYSAPFCYEDGYRLARNDSGDWTWTRLPDLPQKLSFPAMSVLGTKIYLFGGADYDGETAFFTEHDRRKQHPRLGAQLFVLDAADLDAGWRPLPECPGTPRFVHTMQAVGGTLYVIGGATGDVTKDGKRYGYCTVVDNWAFEPATEQWSRLRDSPVSSGNFPSSANLVFQDRYILLPGGHQYGSIQNPDGTLRPAYGQASRKRAESGLHNDVFVYDIQTDTFAAADPLPIDNNLPMSVVRGDRLYLVGGETGGGEIDGQYYGHHPDLLLIGRLTLTKPLP